MSANTDFSPTPEFMAACEKNPGLKSAYTNLQATCDRIHNDAEQSRRKYQEELRQEEKRMAAGEAAEAAQAAKDARKRKPSAQPGKLTPAAKRRLEQDRLENRWKKNKNLLHDDITDALAELAYLIAQREDIIIFDPDYDGSNPSDELMTSWEICDKALKSLPTPPTEKEYAALREKYICDKALSKK